jgi:hypothetical protein
MGIISCLKVSFMRHARHKRSPGDILFLASYLSGSSASLGDSIIPQDEHVPDLRFELIHSTLLKPIRAEVYSLRHATWGRSLDAHPHRQVGQTVMSRSDNAVITGKPSA